MTQPEPERNPVLDILAEFKAGLGGMQKDVEYLRKDREAKRRLNQNIFPLELELIPVAASTVVDQPNTMGPRTGWYWDIETVICQSMAGSSSQVTMYAKNPVVSGTTVTGVQWGVFTVNGQLNWGKKQFYLQANQRIVLSGNASITTAAVVSIYGTQVAAPYWGDYVL